MQEWGMSQLAPAQAALYLAKRRAREILQSNDDPLKHANDFWNLWLESDYCSELKEVGPLADDVHVARYSGQPDNKTRAWLLEKLKTLASRW
jgi:hypothetical protein